VLANRGPKTWDVEFATREEVVNCWLLRTHVMEAFPPVMVEVVKERTFATVCPRGKANVLMIFQVFASFDDTVRDAKGFETTMLLVPSVKRMPFVVLTIIDYGDDRFPRESRMVTVRPAGVWLERRTMAAWPAVRTDVSTSTTDVLAVTI